MLLKAVGHSETLASRASTHSPAAVAAEMSRQRGPLVPGVSISF